MIQTRKDFPIITNNPSLIYLDSTATSLKPISVIEAETGYYEQYSANIYRGVYKISERATEEYENSREVIAGFIHANGSDEIIYTRNTTESLNLIAYALGRQIVEKGDEIVTTIMEHHSNFVPWQQLAFENGAILKVMDIDEYGNLHIESLDTAITKRTKLFAITYVSNVLGTVNPIKQIIARVRKINPKVVIVVDGAQAVPHMPVDVIDLDCDFFAFSSHKMLGPTGVGILWGKRVLLAQMTPFNFGGEMISSVTLEETKYKQAPHKFEAGTPHIAGVIALKHAVKYLQKVGLQHIQEHEHSLVSYAYAALKDTYKGMIRILGPGPESRSGIIAFTFGKYHAHDIAQILDEVNICVRAGNHCAMPLHDFLNVTSSTRASFYLYNTKKDVEALIEGLQRVKSVLS